MVYCLQANLAFSTATRRNNVANAITTRINGKPRWSVDQVLSVPTRAGTNGLMIELRFVSKADQADLESRMASLFPANPPLAGSWMTIHDCTHDEATNDCVVTGVQEW